MNPSELRVSVCGPFGLNMDSRPARRVSRLILRAMAKTYRPYVPEQDLLLPPSLREWLPEDHLAYFVSDLTEQLDLSAITTLYEDEERGYPPYHPVMLTKVLVYAYCNSSRFNRYRCL